MDQSSPEARIIASTLAGDLRETRLALRQTPRLISCRDENGDTLLHLAVRERKTNLVQFLLDERASPAARNFNQSSPLHLAAEAGVLVNAQLLVHDGCPVNLQDGDSLTALHISILSKNFEIIEYLVEEAKSDLTARDQLGRTVLHLCVIAECSTKYLQFFLEHGVSPNTADYDGESAILMAEQMMDFKSSEFLRSFRGFSAAVAANDQWLDKKRQSQSHLKNAQRGHLISVKYLIDQKYDIEETDSDGNTLLHLAVKFRQIHTVLYLLQSGAEVDPLNILQQTPLHLAGQVSDPAFAIALCDLGADTNARDIDGMTPLMHACLRGLQNTTRFFLTATIKRPNLETQTIVGGRTALSLAMSRNHPAVVKLLVENGARVQGQEPEIVRRKDGELHLRSLLFEQRCELPEANYKARMIQRRALLMLLKISQSRTSAAEDLKFRDSVAPALLQRVWRCFSARRRLRKMLQAARRTYAMKYLATHTITLQKNFRGHIGRVIRRLRATELRLRAEKELLLSWALSTLQCSFRRKISRKRMQSAKGNRDQDPFSILIQVDRAPVDAPGDLGKLMTAALVGNSTAIRAIFSLGISARYMSPKGYSALHCAVMCKHLGNAERSVDLILRCKGDAKQRTTFEKMTALILACTRSRISIVERLLQDKGGIESVNSADVTGNTALHHATCRGNLEVAQRLVTAKADPTFSNSSGKSALHTAAQSGNVELVDMMWETVCELYLDAAERGDADTVSRAATSIPSTLTLVSEEGLTGLMLASSNGSLNVVMALLQRGANVHDVDDTGATAMHFACACPDDRRGSAVIAALIEFKADPLAQTIDTGLSPLHTASLHSSSSCVQKLLSYKIVEASIELQTHFGDTALHCASRGGSLHIVKLLVASGCEMNPINASGESPLDVAVGVNNHLIISYLNATIPVAPDEKVLIDTLMAAIERSDLKAIDVVSRKMKNVNIRDMEKEGATPIMIAASMGNADAVKILVKNGADVTLTDNDGFSVAHCAAMCDNEAGSAEILDFLAKIPFDLSLATMENTLTPLHLASTIGNKKAVESILSHLPLSAIMSTSTLGDSALHCAASSGSKEVVQLLLDANCDPLLRNQVGLLPLHVAQEANHIELLPTLKQPIIDLVSAVFDEFYNWAQIVPPSNDWRFQLAAKIAVPMIRSSIEKCARSTISIVRDDELDSLAPAIKVPAPVAAAPAPAVSSPAPVVAPAPAPAPVFVAPAPVVEEPVLDPVPVNDSKENPAESIDSPLPQADELTKPIETQEDTTQHELEDATEPPETQDIEIIKTEAESSPLSTPLAPLEPESEPVETTTEDSIAEMEVAPPIVVETAVEVGVQDLPEDPEPILKSESEPEQRPEEASPVQLVMASAVSVEGALGGGDSDSDSDSEEEVEIEPLQDAPGEEVVGESQEVTQGHPEPAEIDAPPKESTDVKTPDAALPPPPPPSLKRITSVEAAALSRSVLEAIVSNIIQTLHRVPSPRRVEAQEPPTPTIKADVPVTNSPPPLPQSTSSRREEIREAVRESVERMVTMALLDSGVEEDTSKAELDSFPNISTDPVNEGHFVFSVASDDEQVFPWESGKRAAHRPITAPGSNVPARTRLQKAGDEERRVEDIREQVVAIVTEMAEMALLMMEGRTSIHYPQSEDESFIRPHPAAPSEEKSAVDEPTVHESPEPEKEKKKKKMRVRIGAVHEPAKIEIVAEKPQRKTAISPTRVAAKNSVTIRTPSKRTVATPTPEPIKAATTPKKTAPTTPAKRSPSPPKSRTKPKTPKPKMVEPEAATASGTDEPKPAEASPPKTKKKKKTAGNVSGEESDVDRAARVEKEKADMKMAALQALLPLDTSPLLAKPTPIRTSREVRNARGLLLRTVSYLREIDNENAKLQITLLEEILSQLQDGRNVKDSKGAPVQDGLWVLGVRIESRQLVLIAASAIVQRFVVRRWRKKERKIMALRGQCGLLVKRLKVCIREISKFRKFDNAVANLAMTLQVELRNCSEIGEFRRVKRRLILLAISLLIQRMCVRRENRSVATRRKLERAAGEIERCFRGHNGRLVFRLKKKLYLDALMSRDAEARARKIVEEQLLQDKASVVLQRCYRGHMSRLYVKNAASMYEQFAAMSAINLAPPPDADYMSEVNEESGEDLHSDSDDDFMEAVSELRAKKAKAPLKRKGVLSDEEVKQYALMYRMLDRIDGRGRGRGVAGRKGEGTTIYDESSKTPSKKHKHIVNTSDEGMWEKLTLMAAGELATKFDLKFIKTMPLGCWDTRRGLNDVRITKLDWPSMLIGAGDILTLPCPQITEHDNESKIANALQSCLASAAPALAKQILFKFSSYDYIAVVKDLNHLLYRSLARAPSHSTAITSLVRNMAVLCLALSQQLLSAPMKMAMLLASADDPNLIAANLSSEKTAELKSRVWEVCSVLLAHARALTDRKIFPINDLILYADVLEQMSFLFRQQGKYQYAVYYIQQATRVVRSPNFDRNPAVNNRIVTWELQHGSLRAALQEYSSAGNIVSAVIRRLVRFTQTENNHNLLLTAFLILGISHFLARDPDRTIAAAKTALSFCAMPRDATQPIVAKLVNLNSLAYWGLSVSVQSLPAAQREAKLRLLAENITRLTTRQTTSPKKYRVKQRAPIGTASSLFSPHHDNPPSEKNNPAARVSPSRTSPLRQRTHSPSRGLPGVELPPAGNRNDASTSPQRKKLRKKRMVARETPETVGGGLIMSDEEGGDVEKKLGLVMGKNEQTLERTHLRPIARDSPSLLSPRLEEGALLTRSPAGKHPKLKPVKGVKGKKGGKVGTKKTAWMTPDGLDSMKDELIALRSNSNLETQEMLRQIRADAKVLAGNVAGGPMKSEYITTLSRTADIQRNEALNLPSNSSKTFSSTYPGPPRVSKIPHASSRFPDASPPTGGRHVPLEEETGKRPSQRHLQAIRSAYAYDTHS